MVNFSMCVLILHLPDFTAETKCLRKTTQEGVDLSWLRVLRFYSITEVEERQDRTGEFPWWQIERRERKRLSNFLPPHYSMQAPRQGVRPHTFKVDPLP